MPELTVLKKNVVEDYMAFVEALDYKFQFEDKDAFQDDFVEVVKDINTKGTYDAGLVMDNFLKVIKKHSTIKDLEENAKMAINELNALGKLDV